MRNIKFVLSYDGTDFKGWQTQPDCRTVQETLENAIKEITGEKVHVLGSGRTDAGVHAVGQVANFRTSSRLTPDAFLRAVTTKLPEDICIREASEVDYSFDSSRHAVRKLYRYIILDSPLKNPFMRKYAFRCKHRLDARKMAEACKAFLGTHDFHSFETNWPNRNTSIRTILHISVNRVGEFIWVDIEADGFLYNMVRSIVGTLIQIGRDRWPVDCVKKILEAQDRMEAGPTAPPEGLYLMRVSYE
ncbi:tRNA pseudouridine(38-40) synthase TruA [Telmatocola sphagniphila]|uniref:tRNA pseudouridine synthase A n=1 Tax=Telmatocola sphagniphila TaxID=1123043 RepID=A0A8E6B2F4_9BACT|nr:tRNA pseudouridine(38-40) synthase TruA [Telmatocola sphagniphila]QVL30673.1 tRNA pseudouridine(38-40) synthase TruA [Telmatocola sphagniphila]